MASRSAAETEMPVISRTGSPTFCFRAKPMKRKVLGNALKVLMGENRKVICIDNIFVKDGDYVDIGEPVAGGRVVPTWKSKIL